MDEPESARRPREETLHLHRRSVERVIHTLRDHLDEEFPLEQMAEVAYMSPFHFNRVFRQVTGVPPCRFLTAMRLETAKRLLLTTGESVTDISLDVGYSSLGTFTRRFGELVGVSPSQFRSLLDEDMEEVFEPLQGLAPRPPVPPGTPGVRGRVRASGGTDGPVFVGAFPSAVPQSRPVACALLAGPGEFVLGPVVDGDYNLVTASLPAVGEATRLLLYESALRGGLGGRPVRVRGGRAEEPVTLELRPPEIVDPPILLTFPVLLAELGRGARLAGSAQRLAVQ